MAAQRVVIATDSFKGSIGADAAGLALGEGWHSVHPADEVVCLPMADGGEGTLDAVARAVPTARRMPVTVRGPGGVPVVAEWLWLPPTAGMPGGTGLVELANTSGIELLEGRLRPLDADTHGLGQAISAALESGVSRLVIGLGSSASTDGGAGALVALGAKFMDAGAHPIAPGGRGLHALTAVDLSALAPLPPGGVTILTDVPNPLLGPGGAAAVFGPQKGATPADVAMLDAGLARLAKLLGGDPAAAGAGAAGGTGFGLLAWGAKLRPGAPAVAELLGLAAAVAGASIVITGEGSFDAQSAAGKVPGFVAVLAAEAGVPAALIAGRIEEGAELNAFARAHSLTELAGSTAAALEDPARWLRAAGARLAASSRDQRVVRG